VVPGINDRQGLANADAIARARVVIYRPDCVGGETEESLCGD
jgi:hypothetical protein